MIGASGPRALRRNHETADVVARDGEFASQVHHFAGEIPCQPSRHQMTTGALILMVEDLGRVRVFDRRSSAPRANLAESVVGLALINDGRVVAEQRDEPVDVVRIELEIAAHHVGKSFVHSEREI